VLPLRKALTYRAGISLASWPSARAAGSGDVRHVATRQSLPCR
jgi:hypothetical protein